jgi:hypothetical protein
MLRHRRRVIFGVVLLFRERIGKHSAERRRWQTPPWSVVPQRNHLTPTGLLMEGDLTQNPFSGHFERYRDLTPIETIG